MSTDKRICNIKIEYYGNNTSVTYAEIELFADKNLDAVQYWISCNVNYNDEKPTYLFCLASWCIEDIIIDDLTLLNEEQLFQYFTLNSNPKIDKYEVDIYLIYELQKYIKNCLPNSKADTEEIITIEY